MHAICSTINKGEMQYNHCNNYIPSNANLVEYSHPPV